LESSDEGYAPLVFPVDDLAVRLIGIVIAREGTFP
jgi:hypothetical protein